MDQSDLTPPAFCLVSRGEGRHPVCIKISFIKLIKDWWTFSGKQNWNKLTLNNEGKHTE